MNILIAGCGYIGRAAGTLLIKNGHRVRGLCRSDASLERVREAGIEPFKADLADPRTLNALPPVDAVIACQAPARSGRPPAGGESYEAAYLEATERLIQAVGASGSAGSKGPAPVRFIFVSSTSVLGPRAGAWVDADTPVDGEKLDDDAWVLRRTEERVLAAPMRGMVLRLSGIYGPGRHRLDALRSGRMKPAASPAFTNRIHRDDAALALAVLLDRGEPGNVYLATDDAPVTQAEFYGWLSEKIGLSAPVPVSVSEADEALRESKRCSNAKLKQLGWVPRYPSYREGYGELLADLSGRGAE